MFFRTVKTLIRSILVMANSSELAQAVLQKLVLLLQFAQGIGSGTSDETSGEGEVIKRLVRTGVGARRSLVIFDVGANIGQFLRMVQRELADKVQYEIHCFEPGLDSFSRLKESTSGVKGVVLNRLALSNKQGKAVLYSDTSASALASLSKRRLDHFHIDFNLSQEIEMRSLDDYCAEHKITEIDLLKIDVEGHDLDVLKGAMSFLRARAIRMITFEFGGGNIDSRTYFQDFYYFLLECGYSRIFRITPSGYLFPIKQYGEYLE